MTTEHENDRLALEQDIRKHLTIAMDDQVQRFADQIELMKEIDTYFQAYGEDLSTPGMQAHLQNARDKLDYQHPFQIVVIGVSGAGKSSLINALLGSTFAPVGNLGGAQ